MSSNPRIWTTEDSQQLTSLREAAGLDIAILAKRHSLSIHQVRQLEEGGDDRFYSQAIKLQVGRKLLRSLGGDLVELPEPEMSVAEALPSPVPEPAHASAVVRDATESTGVPKSPSRLWLPLGGVALLALAWLGWQQSVQEPSLQKKNPNVLAAVVPAKQAELAEKPPAGEGAPGGAASEVATPLQASPPAEASAEPTPAVEPTASVAASGPSGSCAFGADPIRVSVFEPQKPGNYVYFEAQQAVQVCVKDAAQQTTVLDLPPGRGRTVRGTAPFEVVSERFDAVRIFYQGKMVAPGMLTAPHVVLRPQAIAASAPVAN